MLTDIANAIVVWIPILVAMLPLIVKIMRLLTSKTKNQNITNLMDRANIIVNALEQSGFTGDEKKNIAMAKLANYAKEVGINMTGDQLDDYIESAVKFLKSVTNGGG